MRAARFETQSSNKLYQKAFALFRYFDDSASTASSWQLAKTMACHGSLKSYFSLQKGLCTLYYLAKLEFDIKITEVQTGLIWALKWKQDFNKYLKMETPQHIWTYNMSIKWPFRLESKSAIQYKNIARISNVLNRQKCQHLHWGSQVPRVFLRWFVLFTGNTETRFAHTCTWHILVVCQAWKRTVFRISNPIFLLGIHAWHFLYHSSYHFLIWEKEAWELRLNQYSLPNCPVVTSLLINQENNVDPKSLKVPLNWLSAQLSLAALEGFHNASAGLRNQEFGLGN